MRTGFGTESTERSRVPDTNGSVVRAVGVFIALRVNEAIRVNRKAIISDFGFFLNTDRRAISFNFRIYFANLLTLHSDASAAYIASFQVPTILLPVAGDGSVNPVGGARRAFESEEWQPRKIRPEFLLVRHIVIVFTSTPNPARVKPGPAAFGYIRCIFGRVTRPPYIEELLLLAERVGCKGVAVVRDSTNANWKDLVVFTGSIPEV
jgi:hypothetical protein